MPSRRLSCSARRPRCRRRPGRERARLAAGRRPGASRARQVSRVLAEPPPRSPARLGRAPGRCRRRGGRVAASAGWHGERPSGAGLVEPKLPPLQCRAGVAAAACRTPRPTGANVPRRRPGASNAEPPADPKDRRRGSRHQLTGTSSHYRWTGDHGRHAVGQPPPWSEPTHVNACEASRFPSLCPGARAEPESGVGIANESCHPASRHRG